MDNTQRLQRVEAEIADAKAAVKVAEDFFKAATDREGKATWASIVLARSTTLQQLTTEHTTLVGRLAITGAGSLDAIATGIQEMKQQQQALEKALNDHYSHTRAASKMSKNDVEKLTGALNLQIIWEPSDPTLDSLLAREPDKDEAKRKRQDPFWDEELTETSQYKAYADKLRDNIPFRQGTSAFEVHDSNGQNVEADMEGAPFTVAGQNDVLISLRFFHNDPPHGAVMGVELKKKLGEASYRQALTEYILFAPRSYYPFIQVATDLESGGMAFYLSGQEGIQRIITCRIFKGMESFWDFFTSCLRSVPMNLASNENMWANELPNPHRLRLFPHMPTQSVDIGAAQSAHAALRKVASIFNNWGDVANLADLQGFDELGTPAAIHAS